MFCLGLYGLQLWNTECHKTYAGCTGVFCGAWCPLAPVMSEPSGDAGASERPEAAGETDRFGFLLANGCTAG